MIKSLPKRLKADAILEALVEIRFEPDPSLVPEMIYGRLAGLDAWKEFRPARLPTADIPAQIRRADVNFKYQPSIALSTVDGQISVRIGPNSISYHRLGKYPGWQILSAEMEAMTNHLYDVLPNLHVSRIGLRYINGLTSNVHGVSGIKDMDITASVASEQLIQSLNLNYKSNQGTHFETMARISTVDLAEGNIPEHTTVIVDIDVYTGSDFSARSSTDVFQWIKTAHEFEKEVFFKTLGADATERLRED